MSRSILALAVLWSISTVGPAHAFDGAKSTDAGTLELATGAKARTHAMVRVGKAPVLKRAAWNRLLDHVGAKWIATWDRATEIPRRIYGEGLSAPSTVADGDAAALFSRAFLARHIELLAPGSRITDFVMVSNVERRGIRVVGFAQHHRGLRVHSGQVSFRFKNDRLVVVGSEALPNVSVSDVRAGLPAAAAQVVGATWLLESAASAELEEIGEPMILPIVGNDRVIEYRTVVPVTMWAQEPIGKWNVYVDAATGKRVARTQTLLFADGELFYNAPVRLPQGGRQDYAVPDTNVIVDGLALLTNIDGTLTWAGQGTANVVTQTFGPLARIVNMAGEADVGNFNIAPDGTIVWDERNDELIDAQITTYVHTLIVKEASRVLAPDLEFIDTQQIANVNINDSCNAFSDGTTINFFRSSAQCTNTARLPDVIYHEYGHSLHANSVIPGVGFFNSAHSEGLSDYLAATITGDPGMGRGFFRTDAPLRHIDPTDKEHRWPDDVAGPHFTGLIFSGAMWDLRTLLMQRLGDVEGDALADRLFYATLERGTDIPSTYVEVLLEDDDDGNLANGTPNACDINAAFGPHGLRNLDIELSPLSAELPDAGGHPISVTLSGLFEQCPGDQVDTVTLGYKLEADEDAELEVTELLESDGSYAGLIPSIPDGNVVNYAIGVTLADLTSLTFPDNAADGLYQFYVGETVELYCTDFETDPFAEGWSHSLGNATNEMARDDWVWAIPDSPPAAQDPPTAFSGDYIIGNDLGGATANGLYQPDTVVFAESPVIEVENYTDVHLQYRRWLTVEDAFYDRAAIFVNGALAWQNLNSDMGTSSSIHHEDREWRFHDVAISKQAVDKKVKLRFEIQSDGGLQFGGWNIDDVCIVANVNSICGDGNITGAEECDDAGGNNDTEGNACRTDCRAASCGDGVVDNGEECDDGNLSGVDECSDVCRFTDSGGGCCQTGGGNGTSTAALIVLVLALTWRRRSGQRAKRADRRARR